MAGASKHSCIVKKCCIIGLGLIGSSLGMALGKYGVILERWGYDLNPRAMEEAKEQWLRFSCPVPPEANPICL